MKLVHGTTLGPAGDDQYLMPQIVGSEMWLYLTFVVLPVLYIWIRCYIRVKVDCEICEIVSLLDFVLCKLMKMFYTKNCLLVSVRLIKYL